ncbi:MAG: UDP-N-acetylmuramoyl-L-alanine--D-glutamate ligase [Clostridiales Family XIII bacterium]|jgi:UDP-N-acetylmuramoylalanine--D-glutamate ligase|nr:UDP-N-acetylmuramoyl-L-alanine--D-glutamate ligase [Clostridiales Family XIII bacterium]
MSEPVVFLNKKILIVGLGISGQAAFDALAGLGAVPAVYDAKDIAKTDPEFYERLTAADAYAYLAGRPAPDVTWDYVILSPGVPPDLPFLQTAAARGAQLIGELELSYLLGHGKYAAITGTNGKTTTTTLVYEIFKDAGLDAVVAGNIGNAVVTEALRATDDTWLVTEVSSFQLETTQAFRPRISALLNLTPDHLDRHKTFENYAEAKARIFANQSKGDFFVYNADDAAVAALAQRSGATNVPFSRTRALPFGLHAAEGRLVYVDETGTQTDILAADEVAIPGAHNLENALAAAAVALCAGISADVIAGTLRRFRGVAHRLEHVTTIDGIRFVNDSKGTNPDAAIKALEAVGKDIILIAGGYDKGADFASYAAAAKDRVKVLIVMGVTAPKIRAAAESAGIKCIDTASDMNEAVQKARKAAAPGDTVLLSPACASWDMYENFEERGDDFRRLAEALKETADE